MSTSDINGSRLSAEARYKLLCAVGNRLNSLVRLDHSLTDLLTQIVEEAAHVIQARAGSLMLVADDGEDLIFEVAYGEKGALLKGMRVPMNDQTIAGRVARHGEPLIIDDVSQTPFFSGAVDRTIDFQTESLVCVPLRAKERTIGVLEVLNKISGEPFTTDDAELLAALAGSAAIAIENARLLNEITRRADQLEQLLGELQRTYSGTMHALSALLDTRDENTAGHSQRVVLFTLAIARAMGITDRDRLRNIEYGALLHDVGKIGVPDAVLHKPGHLTSEERDEMRKHPELGYSMLKDIDFLRPACPIILYHHERWDGQGYPRGLHSESIPEEARIFAVADVFDALTSDRPYHAARSYAEARAMIEGDRGTHFDPVAVDAFCAIPEAEWQRMRDRVAAGARPQAGYATPSFMMTSEVP
jgi:HD-GYP domain-containing protein (c-di-GMP phosphodiesterase class II)